ncbi:MAG: ruvC [Candidatus Taylorbacteria bacterium]|nr:ruvC [Candidatus Taylorbacteria bacterium]
MLNNPHSRLARITMKVLGIDPGYDRLGIAVVEKSDSRSKEIVLYSACFTTSAKDDFYARLVAVGNEIARVLELYKPECLGIESLFITKNQKTAMHVAETRGVIAYESVKRGLSLYEYTPGQIKIAVTGHGASDKSQVIKMIPLLVKLDEATDVKPGSKPGKKTAKLDDEYDAIAVALTCIAHEFNRKK